MGVVGSVSVVLVVNFGVPPGGFFVSGFRVFWPMELEVSILYALLAPLHVCQSIRMFSRVHRVLHQLFCVRYVDERGSNFLAGVGRVLGARAINEVHVPVAFVEESFHAITGRLLGAMFEHVSRNTTVTRRTWALVRRYLPSIVARQRPTGLAIHTIRGNSRICLGTSFLFRVGDGTYVFVNFVED